MNCLWKRKWLKYRWPASDAVWNQGERVTLGEYLVPRKLLTPAFDLPISDSHSSFHRYLSPHIAPITLICPDSKHFFLLLLGSQLFSPYFCIVSFLFLALQFQHFNFFLLIFVLLTSRIFFRWLTSRSSPVSARCMAPRVTDPPSRYSWQTRLDWIDRAGGFPEQPRSLLLSRLSGFPPALLSIRTGACANRIRR